MMKNIPPATKTDISALQLNYENQKENQNMYFFLSWFYSLHYLCNLVFMKHFNQNNLVFCGFSLPASFLREKLKFFLKGKPRVLK